MFGHSLFIDSDASLTLAFGCMVESTWDLFLRALNRAEEFRPDWKEFA